MKNKRRSGQGREGNPSKQTSTAMDTQLIALVRLLARRAAERDYEAYTKAQHTNHTDTKS